MPGLSSTRVDRSSVSLHPNLLPTAELLPKIDIECRENGHVETYIGLPTRCGQLNGVQNTTKLCTYFAILHLR